MFLLRYSNPMSLCIFGLTDIHQIEISGLKDKNFSLFNFLVKLRDLINMTNRVYMNFIRRLIEEIFTFQARVFKFCV